MLGLQKQQTSNMAKITLKQLVDDILLLVRNNNISESEDLSRAQIIMWIRAYKHQIIKDRIDRQKDKSDDLDDLIENVDDIYIKEKGPLELIDVDSLDGLPIYTRRIKNKLEGIFDDDEDSILAVHDQQGENIQYMNHIRRHYHYFRKYTARELTAYYQNGYVYVQGNQDLNQLRYIWVLAVYEDDDDDIWDKAKDESEILIPAWMIAPIKNAILKNELPFMLGRPSDDSNNSTLASVKPHGPQDDEE